MWEKAEWRRAAVLRYLWGAGDAIGAAVARRFAKGGYTICICRRDASKSQGLVGELRAAGHNIHAFSVDTRQEAEVPRHIRADRERVRAHRGLPLQRGIERPTNHCWRQPRSCSSRPWELACYWAASWSDVKLPASCFPRRTRHHLLYGCDGQCARRPGVCGIFISESSDFVPWRKRWARELGPKNIHVVHLLIDAGVDSEAIHQRMKAAKGIEASDIPADSLTKTSLHCRCLLVHPPAKQGWVDPRARSPSVHGEVVTWALHRI